MKVLLRFVTEFEEYMPDWILQKYRLMPFIEALQEIHFPSDFRLLRKARLRLAFDELFMIQFLALKRKWRFLQGVSENFHKHIKVDLNVLKPFIDTLSFTLTRAQKKALTEILARQHFENFRKFFEPFGISCDLLIGSKKESEKKIVKQRLFLGELD